MNWKEIIYYKVPRPLVNKLFLTFPFLYRIKSVSYESALQEKNGIEELLTQLEEVLPLEGNIIECGSATCGSSIIMAKYLQSKRVKKTIYVCDSFEGFDKDQLEKERQAGLTFEPDDAFTYTSYEYVKKKINKLKVQNTIIIVKGFFEETLPYIKSNYCFALVDCDLKDSLIYCAETIWPNLKSKGRILFDDYTYEVYRGARIGIETFVSKYKNEISEHGLLNRLYYVCKK
jgi:hypothetical protein